ncbi:hypothetical protein RHSIM_Rhsim13G0015000 [Rhododendron simsii]|uniref:KIB1-4 beta-propeller domain-containing protein n=1 Tax=Rhododendron simsii TaxID=118357 RepID=A0A834L5I8_RHOSS|nr:hypothetical protein RHSIM_Rhsim13G0015000 [Rhododendron simsii]
MLLMNPFTKATIKLPDVEKLDGLATHAGSFSTTSEGYPHCVVLRCGHFGQGHGGLLIRRIAYVGNDKTGWSKISFAGETVQYFDLFKGLLVHGQYVYCFDVWGMTIRYNMETHAWKEIPPRPENAEIGHCYMMEYEGDIVRVDRKRGHGFSLTMFRYNAIASSWEKFNNNDDDVMLKESTLVSCSCSRIVTIAFVQKQQKKIESATGWPEISFAGETVQYLDLFNGFLIHGQHVYCFDPWGMTIIYNMETDHEWKEIIENGEVGLCHMMEYEGEIIRVCKNQTMFKCNAIAGLCGRS